jgi:IclR family transcriptional regulator, acetate operon repressor
MTTAPQFLTPAVASAMRILEFLALSPDAGLAEISARLELNKSTCFNILSALASFGVVIKLPGARYKLGPKLIELGSAARRKLTQRAALRERLHDLVDEFRVTAVIAQMLEDRTRVVIVDRIAGPRETDIAPAIGQTYELTAPALGRVALSTFDPEEALEIIRRIARPKSKADENKWSAQLSEIRRLGFATSWQEYRAGVNAVAAAIGWLGEPATAIGLVGRIRDLPTSRLQHAGRRLVALARELEDYAASGGRLRDSNEQVRKRPARRAQSP